MAVVDIAREVTAEAKEKFLLRYKNKAYKKILNKVFLAARHGSDTITVRLDELLPSSLNDNFFKILKNVIVDDFRQDGFYVEIDNSSYIIIISWENKNEQ